MNALLRVSDIAVSYWDANAPEAQRIAVRNFSMTLAPGETLYLAGPSGSGKSSVLMAIAGLLPLRSGHVDLLGTRISELSCAQRRPWRRHLQLMLQDAAGTFDPLRPVDDSLLATLRWLRPEWEVAARDHALQCALDIAGLPKRLMGRRSRELSGGEARRAALARALCVRPEVLLLDEPFAGLGAQDRFALHKRLKAMQTQLQTAILFVSHDPMSPSWADRTLHLGEGSPQGREGP